jgi:hypothetical protein
MTRSTSHLSKQVVPSEDEEDEDDQVEDDVVLATHPSLPSRSQSDLLSSQTRHMLARPGSSTLDERVSVARLSEAAGDEDEQGSFETAQRDEMEAELGYSDQDLTFEEDTGDLRDDEEEEEEDEDEEDTMNDSRSEEELQAISYEMDGLERAVPGLMNKYHLVDRLGEGAFSSFVFDPLLHVHAFPPTGTFSSVYKAIDLQHHAFDNSSWRPAGKKGKAYVAIKRIYVTSSPIRIQNELDILNDLRYAALPSSFLDKADFSPLFFFFSGSRNVAYLIDAMRHEDQVLAVMPFNRHQDFRVRFSPFSPQTIANSPLLPSPTTAPQLFPSFVPTSPAYSAP